MAGREDSANGAAADAAGPSPAQWRGLSQHHAHSSPAAGQARSPTGAGAAGHSDTAAGVAERLLHSSVPAASKKDGSDMRRRANREKSVSGVEAMEARRPELARKLEASIAPVATDHAEGDSRTGVTFLASLPEATRVSIAALTAACSLWPGHSAFDRAWARSFVTRVCVSYLKLSADVVPALAQLLPPPGQSTGEGAAAGDGRPAVVADPAIFASAIQDPGGATQPSAAGASADAGSADSTDSADSADCALRWDVLRSLLLALVAEMRYEARARACLSRCAAALGVQPSTLRATEGALALALRDGLRSIAREEGEGKSGPAAGRTSRTKRYAMIGGASFIGGAALMLTGGLAAPAIAGGLATFGGAIGGFLGATTVAAGVFLATASGAALLTGVFGATGGGLAAYKMSHRTGDLKVFDIHSSGRLRAGAEEEEGEKDEEGEGAGDKGDQGGTGEEAEGSLKGAEAPDGEPALAVVVCVSGFLAHEREYFTPWGAPVPLSIRKKDAEEGEEEGKEEGEDEGGAAFAAEAGTEAGAEAEPAPAPAEAPTLPAASPAVPSTRAPADGDSAEGHDTGDGATSQVEWVEESEAGEGDVVTVERPEEEEEEGEDSAPAAEAEPWEWTDLHPEMEQYVVRWEPSVLKRMHGLVRRFLVQQAAGYAAVEALKTTVASSLLAAFALPATLIQAASVIDNPYAVARDRACKTGRVLAEALLTRAQGHRPVTLLGYSSGARAVLECLLELQRAGEKGHGIVENAVIMGAPAATDSATWAAAREVVAGRLVNCYSRSDWVLGFLHRAEGVTRRVAGLQPVDANGVEDVDVTDLVKGHLRYGAATRAILERVAL